MESLINYTSEEFHRLSEFKQEEITNNFKRAILYKMKEKNLDIDTVGTKAGYTGRQLSTLLHSDTVNYETHAELQRILAVVNAFPD